MRSTGVAPLVLLGLLALPDRADGQQIPPAVLDRAKHATVMVWTLASRQQKGDTVMGTGTGYFINGTGLLITNNHVVDPAHGKSRRERQEIQYETNKLVYKVITDSGTEGEKIWECDLLHQSLTADQALLQARDADGHKLATPDYLRLLPTNRLKEGTAVCALGFPGGNSQREDRRSNAAITVTTGAVTSVPRAPSGRVRRIETDVIARPGNSGGPMIDGEGFVVGTVTLLGQTEDQANTSALVPTALTEVFLRDAIKAGRLPAGSDYHPLLAILAAGEDRLVIPDYKRLDDLDVLYFEGEEQIYGKIENRTVAWTSPLGRFDVPIEAVAYTIRDGKRVHLILEGGSSLSTTDPGSKFHFTASGGKSIERSFHEIPAVAFRLGDRSSVPEDEDRAWTAFESDFGRLIVVGLEGSVPFTSRAGTTDLAAGSISRIEPEEGGDRRIVTLSDGRRVTGTFTGGSLKGTLAATAVPVEIALDKVTWARINPAPREDSTHGLGLKRIMAGADSELVEIARLVRTGDYDAARARLEPWLDRRRLAKMASFSKARVLLLDGVLALRGGDSDALSKFRKCVARDDPNVEAFARGCVEVLKRYGSAFEGQPLSDPVVFRRAGHALGLELIAGARDTLKDRAGVEGKRGEYFKYMSKIAAHEKQMQAAAVFTGPEADDVLVELWKFGLDLGEREYDRLVAEYERTRAGRNRVNYLEAGDLKKIVDKINKVVDQWVAHFRSLEAYGFYQSKGAEPKKYDN